MHTDFACRMENMTILYNSVIGYKMVQREWNSGRKHTGKEVQTFRNIEKECEEVFSVASEYPDAAEA